MRHLSLLCTFDSKEEKRIRKGQLNGDVFSSNGQEIASSWQHFWHHVKGKLSILRTSLDIVRLIIACGAAHVSVYFDFPSWENGIGYRGVHRRVGTLDNVAFPGKLLWTVFTSPVLRSHIATCAPTYGCMCWARAVSWAQVLLRIPSHRIPDPSQQLKLHLRPSMVDSLPRFPSTFWGWTARAGGWTLATSHLAARRLWAQEILERWYGFVAPI